MNKHLKIWTDVFLYANTLTFIYIFIRAFMNNGETLIQINYYKEMYIELTLLTILSILTLIRIYQEYNEPKHT